MTSTSETVLLALFAALEGQMPLGAKLLRNAVLPERVPAGGIAILRDGDPGEPEVLMSPPLYYYEHRAEIDVIADGANAAARDAMFDAIKVAIGTAIAADRTLRGLCDDALAESPSPLVIPVEGDEGLKATTVPVVLAYASADPLL